MTVLFAAPLAIVLAYSLLTRGVYGGVEQPWTLEDYQRLIDPLYLDHPAAVVRHGAGGDGALPGVGISRWRCSYRAPPNARICICNW